MTEETGAADPEGAETASQAGPLSDWRHEAWTEAGPLGAPERAAVIFDRIAALEELAKQMRRELLASLGDANLTAEEVAEIYWRFDKVPMALLGNQKEVWAAAEAHPYWSWRCQGCRAEVFIKSRAELRKRIKAAQGRFRYEVLAPSNLCADCRATWSTERDEAWREQEEKRRRRERELRTMPYREYLVTPEWQERRKAALKRAGYKCQVCNRSRQLHTHHRTYERRGVELARDLIVLCDECHALYHGKGLLPAHED